MITTIGFLIFSSSVLIGYAQQEQQEQQQQFTNQTSAIQNDTTTREALSPENSFRVQIPPGWIISDINNTDSALSAEVSEGYEIVAQLCPTEQQQQLRPQEATFSNTTANVSASSNVNSNQSGSICQQSQDQVIHIVRYPDLGAGMGLDSDNAEDNNNLTPDIIQAYEIQQLHEAGYNDIRIVNSSDASINLDIGYALNNNKMLIRLPAKLAEMTYSTNLTPNETKSGYFLSTATDATSPNLETITGYAIFYEGKSPASIVQEDGQQSTITRSGSLVLAPLSPIRQVFDSFELIASPEAVQAAIAAQAAQVTQQIRVDPLSVEIDSNGTEGEAPVRFELEADITHGTTPYTISWDVDEDGIADSNQQSIRVTFDEAGTYDILLAVSDAAGQIASDTLKIRIEQGEEESSSSSSTDEEEEDKEPQIDKISTDKTVCDPSYADTCIPPPPPNLTCEDIEANNFRVRSPDPHGFDDDNDGIGCESEKESSSNNQQQQQQLLPLQLQQPQSDAEQHSTATDDSPGMSSRIGRIVDMYYNTIPDEAKTNIEKNTK